MEILSKTKQSKKVLIKNVMCCDQKCNLSHFSALSLLLMTSKNKVTQKDEMYDLIENCCLKLFYKQFCICKTHSWNNILNHVHLYKDAKDTIAK